jgi:hypothetical protein
VPSYTVGYIDVYRNGVKLGTADFTATSGTSVVLASGATAGDLVETVSFFVSSVLNAIPAVANAVTETYINTGAVTQSKLGAGVAGNGPAFSAYMSGNQTITASTWTKLNLNTEEFDTNSCYNNSTYRFTPTVAGYYQINGKVIYDPIEANKVTIVSIYKNGSRYKDGSRGLNGAGSSGVASMTSSIVYFNGTTDYVELYAYNTNTTSASATGASEFETFFNGAMVRSA